MNDLSQRVVFRDAVLDFCNIENWRRPVAATLTCRSARWEGMSLRQATPHDCSQNLRHVMNVLRRRIFKGPKSRTKRFNVIPVLETNAAGRFHYHLVIDLPFGVEPSLFWAQLYSIWIASHWGYTQADFQVGADKGWVHYIMKARSKECFADSIDWHNYSKV